MGMETYDIPLVGGPSDGDEAVITEADGIPETLQVSTTRRVHEYRLVRMVWEDGLTEYDRYLYLHELSKEPPTSEGWEVDREDPT